MADSLDYDTVLASQPASFWEDCPYDANLTVLLRMYLAKITEVDQRVFLAERLQLDRKGRRTLHLEIPELLHQRLSQAIVTGDLLPVPLSEELQRVPVDTWLFLVKKSRNYFYQPTLKIDKENAHRFVTNPEPTPRIRDDKKTCSIHAWFQEEESISCTMPNHDYIVLPYANHLQTHAAYVMDKEKLHADTDPSFESETAQFTSRRFFSSEIQESAPDLGHCDHDRLDHEDGTVQHQRTEYRYGNCLLGKKGEAPEHQSIASYSWFNKVWKNHEDLRRRFRVRSWMPFSICTKCSNYSTRLQQTRCQKKKKKINQKKRKHLKFVKRERAAYEYWRQLAKEQPSECLSLIVDAADAQRFSLPHFAQTNHASAAAWKMRMHIMGVISHGRQSYLYTCPSHIAQGNNVTIQAIKEVLVDTRNKEGRLPPVLHVQLDNTTKQCKGKFLMAYLADLVDKGVFREVHVGFLPVGHTHEDIDQLFSRISVNLRVNNAVSRHALGKAMRSSFIKYGKRPIVKHWNSVANISDYLTELGCLSELKKITKYHAFRFVKTEGKLAVQGRTWPGSPRQSTTDYWRGLSGETVSTPIYKESAVSRPDILADMALIPPSQFATRTHSEEKFEKELQKKRDRGFGVLVEEFPHLFCQDDIDDLHELLSMEEGVTSESPIPFDWTHEDLQALYEPAEGALGLDGEEIDCTVENHDVDTDMDDDTSDEDFEVELSTGKYYISRPNIGEFCEFLCFDYVF